MYGAKKFLGELKLPTVSVFLWEQFNNRATKKSFNRIWMANGLLKIEVILLVPNV